MTREEMEEELEQFYEAAGFADYYERVLKNQTDEKIKEMYDNHIKFIEESEEDYKREREEYLKSKEQEDK